MWRGPLVCGLLVWLLLLLPLPVPAGVPSDNLLVPGVRIGRWSVQMTSDEIVKATGAPSDIMSREETRQIVILRWEPDDWVESLTTYWWLPLRFAAFTYQGRRVAYLGIVEFSGVPYRLPKGLHFEASEQKVRAA